VSDVQRCMCGHSLTEDSTGIRCIAACKYDAERREFIREHARRIEAAYVTGLVVSGRELVISAPESSWNLARELWNAKPADC
jgi:hypothetical protein